MKTDTEDPRFKALMGMDINRLPAGTRHKFFVHLMAHALLDDAVLAAMTDSFHRMNGAESIPAFQLEATEPCPPPKLKRDWEGRQVRIMQPLETAGGKIFGVGTIATVTRNYNGLNLRKTEICPHCQCGHNHSINRVPEQCVMLLPEKALDAAKAGA